jgi:hypothetical protein
MLPYKQALAVWRAAIWDFVRSPGLSHALLAALITLVVGAFFALAYLGPWGNAAVCATLMYVMRERRQSEEHFGSNRIPLWQWKPRAGRDIAWPALAAALVAVAIELVW